MTAGLTAPAGDLAARILRGGVAWPAHELSRRDIAAFGLPRFGLPGQVNRWRAGNTRNLWRGARRVFAAKALQVPTVFGSLWVSTIGEDGVVDYGLASMRVVTTAGAGFIVDAFQNLVELENMKYHGCGTGTTAEASSDTALVTESTTALNPDNTRATGSTTEASATVYRTVGTVTFDATAAITEHGIFSQAATGGGILLDRSVFSALNVVSGDSIQFTYDFTVTAGG